MTLSEMRGSTGLSQKQVAEFIGNTTQGAVSQWEIGLTAPQMNKVAKLAQLYNVTTDDIIQAITATK